MRADIDIDIGRYIITIQVEKSTIRAIIPIPTEQGAYPFRLELVIMFLIELQYQPIKRIITYNLTVTTGLYHNILSL